MFNKSTSTSFNPESTENKNICYSTGISDTIIKSYTRWLRCRESYNLSPTPERLKRKNEAFIDFAFNCESENKHIYAVIDILTQ